MDALAKSLKRCALHSGHYYYKELRDCPWCGIEKNARVRLFNFLFSEADSRRGHFRLDEIWKDIMSVEPPDTSLIPSDRMLEALETPPLSAEAASAVCERKTRLIAAIWSADSAVERIISAALKMRPKSIDRNCSLP